MGQVNVTYDDAQIARIDACAEQLGLTRPEFLRQIAAKALAGEVGVETPEPAAPSIDAAALKELVAAIERMAMEQDRALRDYDRRAKRLQDSFHGAEAANQQSLAALAREVRERLAAGEAPFQAELGALREDFASHEQQAVAAVAGAVAPLEARMAKLEKQLAMTPRNLAVDFGKLRLRRAEIWLVWAVGLALLMISEVFLAWLLPDAWFANRLTRTLYGSSDIAICELYKDSRRLENCPVLAPEKTGGKR